VPAQTIRKRGWHQGSVASDSLRAEVSGWTGTTESYDLVIVVTHDCDLISADFDAEPFAELMIARRLTSSDRDGNCFRGKNPRRLQFELDGELYQIRAYEKGVVARALLAEHPPDERRTLPNVVREILPEWLAKRYERSALPDAFNERTRKAREKIRKRLAKDADLVSAIYLTVEPVDELAGEEPYLVIVSVVAESQLVDDDDTGSRLDSLTQFIRTSLTAANGVDVRDCLLLRDNDFSLADMNRSIEWDVWNGVDVRDCLLLRDNDFSLADMNRSIEWDVWDDLSYRLE